MWEPATSWKIMIVIFWTVNYSKGHDIGKYYIYLKIFLKIGISQCEYLHITKCSLESLVIENQTQ